MPRGKTSWYGGPHDSGDNNIPSLPGATNKNPGIAVYSRKTLGGWWRVVFPNGRSLVVQQTDLGPAPWTGKKVDVNYTALRRAGYTEGNYPTGASVEYHWLGKSKPGWADKGAPAAAPKVKAQPQAQTAGPQIGQRQALLWNYLQNRNVPGALADLGKNLNDLGSSTSATPAAPKVKAMAPTAQTKQSGGVTTFDGKPVASWIAPILAYARKHGWKGSVTSGFRSYAKQQYLYSHPQGYPVAKPGTSKHEGSQYPKGAVDVSNAAQLASIIGRSPYRGKLVWAGSKDAVHFSHPGANGSY